MQQSHCMLKLFFAATAFGAVKADLGTVSKVKIRSLAPADPALSPVKVQVSSVTTPLMVIFPSAANTLELAKPNAKALNIGKVSFFIR